MKRRFLVSASAVLAVLMLLAGCGGSRPSQQTPAEQKPVEQAKPPEPAKPKVMTIVAGTDIQRTDVHRVSDSPSFTVLEHITETLFSMTPNGEIKPLLAESYTPSADGLLVTIKLRSGVKFTDGQAFNAAAVKKNLERVRHPDTKSAFANLLGPIKEIRAKDDTTVEIELNSPLAPLQANLAHGFTAMISPAALDMGLDALETTIVGTGPYTLKEWKKGESVTLVRNDSYWGAKPAVETLVFKMVKEAGARIVEIESGTADVARQIPGAEMARLKTNQNLTLDITPGLRTIFFYFNTTKQPFDNKVVRQAINLAVDKDAIVKSVLNEMGRVSDAAVAPNIFGYAPQSAYKADKAKARNMLKEAGFDEKNPLKFELLHPTGRYPEDARIAEAVRAQLREVGVEVTLKTMEWAQYVPYTGEPPDKNLVQVGMLGWSTPTMDADYGLYSLFHKDSHAPAGFNRGFYSNPDVDKLLSDARAETNQAKRKDLYAQANKLIWEDAPWIFLHSEIQVNAIRKDVSGVVIHPSERLIATSADKTAK